MISSDKIIDILIKNQEPAKTGNDGEYYSEMALKSESFRIVANEISLLTSHKQVTEINIEVLRNLLFCAIGPFCYSEKAGYDSVESALPVIVESFRINQVMDAIEFAEWMDVEGWKQIEGSKWYNTISHKYKVTDYYTTAELYEQFKAGGGK